MTKSSKRTRIAILCLALMEILLGGCVFRHRTPPAVFRFTLVPPSGVDAKVTFFLEHKETDPSNGVTRFVPKDERQVHSPSGSPSAFTVILPIPGERFQGGIWQGKVQVSVMRKDPQNFGRPTEVYVGESKRQVTLPYEVPAEGTIIPFDFTLVWDESPENPSKLRITAP